MSKILELATSAIYLIGIVIVLFNVILDKKKSEESSEEMVLVYINKKHCIWNNKINDIVYVIDVIYDNKTFTIRDKNLFDAVQENSYTKMKLVDTSGLAAKRHKTLRWNISIQIEKLF